MSTHANLLPEFVLTLRFANRKLLSNIKTCTLLFPLLAIVFSSCQKTISVNQLSSKTETDFKAHRFFKDHPPSDKAIQQLKRRYGNAANWERYIKNFKPKTFYADSIARLRKAGRDRIIKSKTTDPPRTLTRVTITIVQPQIPPVTVSINLPNGPNQPILDLLEGEGIELPYSARCGVDGTDAAKLESGEVDQSDQTYLNDAQVDAGFILLSVAYPASETLVIRTHQEEELYYFGGYGSGFNGGGINHCTSDLSTANYRGYTYTRQNYPYKAAGLPWLWWIFPCDNHIEADNIRDELLNDRDLEQIETGVPCGASARLGNVFFPGTFEHWLIQGHYLTNYAGGMREFGIPNAGPTCTRKGYADLANILTKEIFEIKPFNPTGIACGTADIANYVAKANLYCTDKGWLPGAIFRKVDIRAGDKVLSAQLAEPGVIVYSWNHNAPRGQPVVVPKSVIDRLKELFKQVLENDGADIETVIANFAANNPDVMQYVKIGIWGIVVVEIAGTLAEDFGTGGAGVWNDWLCFSLAWRLGKIALKY